MVVWVNGRRALVAVDDDEEGQPDAAAAARCPCDGNAPRLAG